jgi:hypothetical protein
MAKGDPKAHQLYKQIPYSVFIFEPSEGGGVTTATNGWEILPGTPEDVAVFRTYIDLSGWSKQDLTTFTQGVDIQKSLIPIKTGDMKGVFEIDLITTRRITDDELLNIFELPGFFSSTLDLMELIYGERMYYADNISVPGTFVQISGETFGSGNPTAMNRLHWTRLFVPHQPVVNDILVIPASNLVVQAMTVEEKDLVWIERLRRSYVQQGEI